MHLFAALVAQLIAAGGFDLSSPEEVRIVLTLAFAAVLLSGCTQVLLGTFRVGVLVKFIPYPVVAGILNCAAILLIYSQMWPFLGAPRQSLASLAANLGEVRPLTVVVAAVTALVVWRGGIFMHRAIVPVVALLLGTLLHHLFPVVLGEVRLGPVLGALPSAFPKPSYFPGFIEIFTTTEYLRLLPILLSGALAIAVLDSLSSLINLVALQSLANRRFDANRQLLGQGVGNAAVSLFGGLSTAGLVAETAMNHKTGGRTTLSGVVNSLTVLLLILVLARFLGFIPHAAIAGLIVVIALGLFDRWSLHILRETVQRERVKRQDLFINLSEMLLVVVVGLTFNLVAAVGAGVVVAILVFVAQMSRSPIRRIRTGTAVRSKRLRDPHLSELLHEHGHRIVVIELEGTVFFGSCDRVAGEMEELARRGADYLIVDLKRVRRIDATGYRILGQAYERLRNTGLSVGFSYVVPDRAESEIARNLILTGSVFPEDCFDTTDHALEVFEDGLLEKLDAAAAQAEDWSIVDFANALGLEEEEHETFARHLRTRQYDAGEFVVRQGETGASMFFLSRGSADVTIPILERGRRRRLSTLTRGTAFGEMSLLSGFPRSADVRAREDLICFELTRAELASLRKRHPEIAMKVFSGIGRILGARLQEANDLISELDV